MPRFRYAGQAPVPDGEGGVVRPGDIRDTEPDFGPWTELPDEDASEAEKPADPPPPPPSARTPCTPPAASTEPPVTDPATTDPEN